MALNVLCSISVKNFFQPNVYKDNKRRRNSHEIICGKKFANEIQDLKQASVVGNKYKPRSHSASRISARGNDYINALEDNDIKYFCQNTLTLASVKSFSPTQPKIFCIEKSNVIVLPSLRNQVGEDIVNDIEEITNVDNNNFIKDNDFGGTNSTLLNDNCPDLDKSLALENLNDCRTNVEATNLTLKTNPNLKQVNINSELLQDYKNDLGK